MLAVLQLVLVSIVVSERPGSDKPGALESNDQEIEFSFVGHLIAKKPKGSHETDNLHPPAPAVAGSLMELSSEPQAIANHTLSSRNTGARGCPQDETCMAGTSSNQPQCASLCYRLWSDSHKWGVCAEFTQDLSNRLSGWLEPDQRFIKRDAGADFLYCDMKRNIPDGAAILYINIIRQNFQDSQWLKVSERKKLSKPIKILEKAFTLYEASLKAVKEITKVEKGDASTDRVEKVVAELESAISNVGNDKYSAMDKGLAENRGVVEKLNAWLTIAKAIDEAEPLAKSNSDKVDDALLKLDEAERMGMANFKDSFEDKLRECNALNDQLHDSLQKYFEDIRMEADKYAHDSGSFSASKRMESFLALQPSIERMKKLDGLERPFNDELSKSTEILEKLEGNMRKFYMDKDLQKGVEDAEKSYEDFKSEVKAMEAARAQVEALILVEDAQLAIVKVNQKIEEFEGKLPKESETPNYIHAKKKKEGEADANDTEVEAEVKLDPKLERENKRLEKSKESTKTKIREALDACRCSEILRSENCPPDMQDQIDALTDAGLDLGDMPGEQRCPSDERATKSKEQLHKKVIGGIEGVFKAGATHPAALSCLLLAGLLGLRVGS